MAWHSDSHIVVTSVSLYKWEQESNFIIAFPIYLFWLIYIVHAAYELSRLFTATGSPTFQHWALLHYLKEAIFMWAALSRKLIVSSWSLSEASSGASINFLYVGDKIQSRQPSCNKWYHLKMWSYDCHILKCMIVCWGGGCTVRGCVCVP